MSEMHNYCDCGDYCEWCHPELCGFKEMEMKPEVMKETWWLVEWSYKGADDWLKLGRETYDAPDRARAYAQELREIEAAKPPHPNGFEYRVVRVTHTEEVEK